MKTSASKANRLASLLAATLVLVFAGVLIMTSPVTPSSASFQEQRERIFENTIPAHIPIEIKIKKEKENSFKDLKNEKWLREFELEVTNTGDKPIYYLDINMDTDVPFEGSGPKISYSVRYGRLELSDIVTKATTDDVPIKPGEKVILTIQGAEHWEKAVREKRWPESTKFQAHIQILSFGDGTGYFVWSLYPPPERRKGGGTGGIGLT